MTEKPTTTRTTPVWRNLMAGLAIVLGVVMLSAAISAVWLNRTVMDEDRWVETMAPLAREVAVQDYVATKASDSLLQAINVQDYVDKALSFLPQQARVLSAPITSAVQGFVRDSATKFVRSESFPTLWDKMNRLTHKAFMASIAEKQGGVVNKSAGKITLDVSVLIDEMKSELASRGLGFVSAIPTPTSARDIVLVDSPALAQLGLVIQFMNASATWLPIISIGLLVVGVAAATDRRKAALWLGIGIVVVTLLPVQAIYLGQYPFAQAAQQVGQVPTPVAQLAYQIVFRNLIRADQLFAIIGIVFVLGAMVAGPSAWATSLRGGLTHGIDNIGPDWDFGPAGEWALAHRTGLRGAGPIVAVIALLIVRVTSVWTIVWIVVAVLAWLAAVQVVARPRLAGAGGHVAGSASSDPAEDVGSDARDSAG